MDSKTKKNLIDMISLLGITIGIYIVFKYLLPLVIPFLISFFIGILLNPWVTKLNIKYRINRNFLTAVILTSLAIIIFLFLKLIIGLAIEQINQFILLLPFYQHKMGICINKCCKSVDKILLLDSGCAQNMLSNGVDKFCDCVLPDIGTKTIGIVSCLFDGFVFIVITLTSTVLILSNFEKIKGRLKQSYLGSEIRTIYCHVHDAVFAYIKAQIIIMFLDAAVCSVSLLIIGNSYYIILGLLIGFVDALPLLGSGAILIPWGLIYMINGEFMKGVTLLVTYAICGVVRQLTEPKVIGNKIGMSSLTTLFAMYIGFELFGILGFVLGPIGFVLIKEIYGTLIKEAKI